MSWKRFMSGAIGIAATLIAIYTGWIFIMMVVALTVGALYEFFYLIKKKKIPIYSYTGILIGLLIPLSIFFQFELTKNWELLFIVCGFLLILMLQFAREDNSNAIVGLSTTMFGVLYVSWFFSFLIKIWLLAPAEGSLFFRGPDLVCFIIAITKSGDMGALVIGTKFGKHRLLPRVSPNKSIEGTLGGIFVSACVAMALQFLLPAFGHFTLWHVALMGAFFGGLGQLGDLSESLIKRDCGVKDSGKFLPGIGGVLDVIDSLLFSVPAFYLYMSSTLNLL